MSVSELDCKEQLPMTNAPNTTKVLRATGFEDRHIEAVANTMCGSRNSGETSANNGDSRPT